MASRSISSSHFLKELDGVGVACWAVSLLEEAIDKISEREVLAYL